MKKACAGERLNARAASRSVWPHDRRQRGAAARNDATTARPICACSHSVAQRGRRPALVRSCRFFEDVANRGTRGVAGGDALEQPDDDARRTRSAVAHRNFNTDSSPAVIVLMRVSDWRTAWMAAGLARKYRLARPPRTGVGSP